jgi:hypothetical protein
MMWEGVLLDVEGTVSADHKALTTSVTVKAQKTTTLREVAHAEATADRSLMIQSPEVSTAELRTIASVPDKATLVLTGGTIAGNPLDRESKDRAQRYVVVLIKPTILIPGDAKADRIIPGPGVPQKVELRR